MVGKRNGSKNSTISGQTLQLPEADSDVASEDFYDSADESVGDSEDAESNESSDSNADDGDEETDDDEEFEVQSDSEGDDSEQGEMAGAISVDAKRATQDAESTRRSWLSERNKKETSSGERDLLHTDDFSSDDEEAEGNTVGRIPLHWYDAYDHVGYDVSGQKVLKRQAGDRIDLAIANSDDPVARRTVYDMYNDRQVVLSQRDMEILRRIQSGAFAHPEHNDTPDYVDYFSSQIEEMPISGRPEAKHKFLPSRFEMAKVQQMVKEMREGRYKTLAEREKEKREAQRPPVYLIWQDDKDDILDESKRSKYHLPAPKMALPGHAESYNPPEEYLLSAEELAKMEDMDPSDRQHNFVPKKHDCLRHVAGYQNFVRERFDRCLDLYLCPRKLKLRLNIDPESLVPKLPRPRELRPYPSSLCLQYIGHTQAVKSICLSPDGQYLASGSDDGTVRIWEVDTCLCRYVWSLGSAVQMVAWNPNSAHHLVAAAVGSSIVIISTGTCDAEATEVTEGLLAAARSLAAESKVEDDGEESEKEQISDDDADEGQKSKRKLVANWKLPSRNSENTVPSRFGTSVGPVLQLHLRSAISHVSWHHKGDYFVTVCPDAGSHCVSIHQLSKAKSQAPFSKSPGRVQAVQFHPSRPYLFVATQQHVKVFHLVEQKLVKKLLSGCKWISSLDVHPSGDHVLLGSYDRRVVWFDLDLASTPYKTLKFHEKAVRDVRFHRRYPLMASASDDGTAHIFHQTVYSDLSRNPMIVPLKILRGHGVIGGMGVLSVLFHPRQPWVFTSGADSLINLYQDL